MSNSLTINVPKIVQTRNTLNAVPSGSTAEVDNNVKYVPQTLTDAQKAQARQNIGAAAEGETGGATVNEFHYKRGGEEGSYYYYIDCQGYTPAEGDLMVVVFDWPMYPEHNPITLMNGSDNPSFVLLNAPVSEYNYYDDIEGTVNTRWMVKLEKVNNVWTAYNVNTVELADWNVTDPTAIGYIKNKPTIVDFEQYNTVTFRLTSAGKVRFDTGQYTSTLSPVVYIDGVLAEAESYSNRVWISSNTYSAGAHVLQYKTTGNRGAIMAKVPENGVEITSTYSRDILGTGGSFDGYKTVIVPRMGQNIFYVRGAGKVEHVVQTSKIDNELRMVNYYVLTETPQLRYADNIYVPKGQGAAWAALNPDATVREYTSISYPEPGTVVMQKMYQGTSSIDNPYYTLSIPQLTYEQDFEQYNTVTFNLPTDGQVWFRKGQHSGYNNITIYIDGQCEGTFTAAEVWTSTYSYAAGRHVMKYKTDTNIGGIMSEGPSNTDDLAEASNFMEYVSMYCPTILGNGANFGGNTAVVVPYPGQDIPDTGDHGTGGGVEHVVQTSVINDTVQIENYYVLSETPATKNVTTFYVPQGTGAAWLALNPGKTVYEYIDLTYPPLGTVVVRSSGYARVNPQYAAAIPVTVLYSSVPLTMTDANGTVISGDFIAKNVTITPAGSGSGSGSGN